MSPGAMWEDSAARTDAAAPESRSVAKPIRAKADFISQM
jgi:hypothetical protein